MNCIIVEDQAPAQRVLKKYIADMGTIELKGTFNNAIHALEFLRTEKVDLIFLDVHLPKVSGIDFLKSLTHPPAVIFTTAFPDYAVQGYELDVVDYLVKPFSFERFLKAVSKVNFPTAQKENLKTEGLEFYIKTGYEYIKINSADVIFIQYYYSLRSGVLLVLQLTSEMHHTGLIPLKLLVQFPLGLSHLLFLQTQK